MLKNYDPSFRYGVYTIEVTLQRWDYKGTLRVKIAGNCKGLLLMGDIDESIFDSFPDIESDCNFEIVDEDWFAADLKNADGDILEFYGNLDELGEMIVKVEIVDFVPECEGRRQGLKLNDKIHEGKVPDELRPVCVCGKRMKLILYTHYYGERLFWDCPNNKCILNEYDFEPDEEEREPY